MKTGSTGFSLLVAIVAGAPACGGNPFAAADGGAEGGTLTQDTACGDNAHAHCSMIQSCSPEVMTVDYGDEGTCETRLKLSCLNGLAAPSTGNTADRAEACAQAYATWACPDYFDGKPPPACVQVTGSLTNGQACAFAGQCQTGFCAIAPGSMCGACANAPQPGDSCAKLTTCGQPLACDTTVQACSSFATAGAACSRAQFCGAGLYCVGIANASGGTCTPAVEQAGETCDPTGKSGPGCDRLAGLTCNSVSNQCATLQYSAAGQPCGSNVDNQYAACASAGTCGAAVGADAAAGETCSPVGADGAPCDLASGPFCRDPARCILTGDAGTSGTCRFADAAQCH